MGNRDYLGSVQERHGKNGLVNVDLGSDWVRLGKTGEGWGRLGKTGEGNG